MNEHEQESSLMKRRVCVLLIICMLNFSTGAYASITIKNPQKKYTGQEIQVENSSQQTQAVQQSIPQPQASTPSNEKILLGSVVQIAKGTPLNVYLQESINTAYAQTGTSVSAMLKEDLIVNNSIIVPQGSFIKGKITHAQPAHNPNKNGKVTILFDRMELPNGEVYQINTEKVDFEVDDEGNVSSNVATAAGALVLAAGAGAILNMGRENGKSSKDNATTGAVVGAGILAVAALGYFLLKKGKDAEIPQYTELSIELLAPVNVTAGQY